MILPFPTLPFAYNSVVVLDYLKDLGMPKQNFHNIALTLFNNSGLELLDKKEIS